MGGPATRFYVLTPTAAGNQASAAKGSRCIGVGPVTLPRLLDRPEIITRRNESEVARAEYDQWADPLEDAVPQVLVDNLVALLGSDHMEARPWTDAGHCQLEAPVEVTRFDGALGGGVVLDVRWRLLNEDGRELAVKRSVLTQATHGASYRDLVAAMSGTLGTLSREIASAVTHTGSVSQAGTPTP